MPSMRHCFLCFGMLLGLSATPVFAFSVEGFSGRLQRATPEVEPSYVAFHATLRCFYESFHHDTVFEKNPNLDVTTIPESRACGKTEVYFSGSENGAFQFPSLSLSPKGQNYGKFYVLSVQLRVAQGEKPSLTRREQRQEPQKQYVNADYVLEGELQYTTLPGGRLISRLRSDLEDIVLYHLPAQEISIALSDTDLPDDLEVLCTAAVVDSVGRGCNSVFGNLGAHASDPVRARADVTDLDQFQTPELYFISLGRQIPRPVLSLSLSLTYPRGTEVITLFEKEGAVVWPRAPQDTPSWAKLFGKPFSSKP